ncbi:kelch repeat protein-like protein [Dendryphion nanum]|uniref:Kelch repeat protein-like protein n=1 Tax=Dendryphion nanum TaxID=256645 RepID=A0A9P9IBG8_9PLEO|nr:kelch repeat protein-like protein [Dendryphion nanum]
MDRVHPQPAVEASGRRKSVFAEVGLVDEATIRRERSPAPILLSEQKRKRFRPSRIVRFRSRNDVFEEDDEEAQSDSETTEDGNDYERAAAMKIRLVPANSMMYRAALLALVLAMMLPILQINPASLIGVKGGAIPRQTIESVQVVKREDTDTNICKRWAHQATIVNGSLYIYGGRSTTDPRQTSDTWNNDFLTLDLTKSWQVSGPSLTGLPRPSGPPEIAMGYLWSSHDSLFLYGGQFSDTPRASPSAASTWEYKIASKTWVEHKDQKTVAGTHAAPAGQPVQRSAEGAGFSVSVLGRGWYFGGHLDDLTTEGWSNQIPRVYLKSLIEFTFPGYSNNAVETLKDGKKAGDSGAYRNITEGGLQDKAGFAERADGILLYIPGFSDEGLLIGLAGGTNDTFTQMNVIDVYDIAKSQWYKQSTSGKYPDYRVNPCAVVAAAADGSSYNVYMFGGQNLQPAKEQIQKQDMWILSIPSFTWIQVDMGSQEVPYGRSGHTCHVWDGQMIVVGGYVGNELSCESPGIYVFNMSSLSWSNQFTALTGSKALQSFNGNERDTGNPLAQQANQRGFDSKAGLEGSYGYAVPAAVQSVIGGKSTGGATLTAPLQTPTEGPLKTGKPHTYTVTGPNGAIITETTTIPSTSGGSGTNVGAIIAGTIAGFFFIVAAYFAFCAWVYRKQVRIWKNHAAMMTSANANRHSADEKATSFTGTGAGATSSSGKNSTDREAFRNALFPPSSRAGSSGNDEIRTSTGERPPVPGTGYSGAGGMLAGERAWEERERERRGSVDSTDDLLAGQEPTFWGTRGVLLNPRRSLRVINRD